MSVVGQTVNPRQNVEPDGRDRTFNLNVVNNTDRTVTFIVSNNGWSCCDSPLRTEVYGPIRPGGSVKVWIARVQGNGCDGYQGTFTLTTSDFGNEDSQMFTFSNDGYIGVENTPNRFTGKLSRKSRFDGSFTYTVDRSHRLPTPVDERLTQPRNYVAYDSGSWARIDSQTTTKIEHLRFSQNGFWPTWYESCFGFPLFHPQHMKRLPNKDGKAYFMISGSRSHNGYLSLIETYPGLLDPVTDLVRPSSNGDAVGKVIWQDVYTGVFNKTYNPIGNWNHPAKIAVMGGVMLVVAQNWSEGKLIDGCTGSTGNPCQRGTSEDAILFYDVRDSSHPVYWGIMTAEELRLPLRERENGDRKSFDARLISVVRFLYHPHRGIWEMTVGGGGEWKTDYTTWETDTVSPNIEDWTLVAGAGTGNTPRVRTSEASEHGDDFDSYQWDEDRAISVPENGKMRSMWFGATNNGAGGGEADGFTFGSLMNTGNMVDQGSKDAPNMGSLGRDRDWASDSLYVTRKGEPIAYTAENDNHPDGGLDGDTYLWQVYDTRNLAVNQKPHPVTSLVSNTFDSGLGSLREAIAYGGSVTFAPSLSGQTIRLTTGPLVAYLQDLDVDASSLVNGLIVSSEGYSSLLQVERGVRVTLRGVTFQDASDRSDSRYGYAIENRGSLELFDCLVRDNFWGGLNNLSGNVLLQNCTFTENTFQAIRNNENSVMFLRHCTVAGNDMKGGATAVANLGAMTLENSIIANNTNGNGPSDTFGVFTEVGANLIGGDPRLAAIGGEGARSKMLEPRPDSPAINVAVTSTIGADGIGRKRPIGEAPDLGAIEAIVVTVLPSSNLEYFSLIDQSLSWTVLPGAEFEVFLDSGFGFESLGKTTSTSIALPDLMAKRDYQWRGDVTIEGRTYPGRAQAFTTRGPLLVTTLIDENDPELRQGVGDSLREILEEASSGELIRFAANLSGGTIRLEGKPFTINTSVTINGANLRERITIDALGNSRAIEVTGAHSVVLKGLRISNGVADRGAGVFNDGGLLTLTECEFHENRSVDQGGAVYNADASELTVSGSTVFDLNQAREGGAIYNATGASLTVDGARFLRNQAVNGGGIVNQGSSFTVAVAYFSGNGAENIGGGIYHGNDIGLVENATFSENSSATGQGGGVANNGQGSLTLRHCTIAGNVGAGVFSADNAKLTLDHSIISGNFDLNNDPFDLQGSYTAIGANLVRSPSGNSLLSGPAPLRSDPLLGSIRSGVIPLLVGSPAIDGGVVTENIPGTDQVRSSRPFGPAPDLGAVESRLSADVDLLWLTTSAGSLSPQFETSTTSYTAHVLGSIETAAVRAAKGNGSQTLAARINGDEFTVLDDKAASPDFPLNPGDNTLDLKVTSGSGTVTRIYTIQVTRGNVLADNLGLASLSTHAGLLTPSFDPVTPNYYVTAPNTTESTTVTATVAQEGSRLEVRSPFGEFMTLSSGTVSDSIFLNEGANPIDLRVIGDDDAVLARYTLTITRNPAPPANANLVSLNMSAGPLNPDFTTGVAFYQGTVPSRINSTTVTPIVGQEGASVEVRVNGGPFTAVNSGSSSGVLTLQTGENIVEAKVTATDGATVRSYTIAVTRRDEQLEWASSPGNKNSESPDISADGRFVAYSSRADNLVPEDTNSTADIFVYDRVTQIIERVSVNNEGVQGNFQSINPSISADGNFVAFESEANNLVPNDRNGQNDRSRGVDIFVYDRSTKTIERVSLTENGEQVNQASRNPSISNDGRYVAFSSGGNNLISGFRNGQVNVYVRDRIENTIVGVSVPFSVTPSNRSSVNPAISGDGNFVAFEFTAGVNDGNRSFKYQDIYLFNRVTRGVERITGTKIGIAADRTESEEPAISDDGRYVVFQSTFENLDFFDTNGRRDVFVYDRITGNTRRVSTSYDGVEELFQDSINPSISGNGRFVAFESKIANFVESDTNTRSDIFVKDLLTGEMMLESSRPDGEQGNGAATTAALSEDGQVVAFISGATNLVLGDPMSVDKVFVASAAPVKPSSRGELAFFSSDISDLNSSFSPNVSDYNIAVDSETEIARIRTFAAEQGMTVRIQINSGGFQTVDSDISALPLSVGSNLVEISITAADGSPGRLYVFTIIRAASNNTQLRQLELSTAEGALPLSPAFASETTNYSVNVGNEIEAVSVIPRVVHPMATVTVNGSPINESGSSGSVPLKVGDNTISIEVRAEDLTAAGTYSVTVTRELSSDAALVSLVPSVDPTSGILPFNADRVDYTMTVDGETASLAFTPEARHPSALITISGQNVMSSSLSSAQSLAIGSNPIAILVTAEDGVTIREYLVNVIRPELAPLPTLGTDANLADLLPSSGTLSPNFTSNNIAYTLSVENATDTLTLTANAADANALITINGNASLTGTPSSPIALAVGLNTLIVSVVAEDGVSAKSYIVSVTRAESSASITISQSNGTVILLYSGTLESAPTVNGPYTRVVGATSPFAVVTQEEAKFFQVK